MLDKHFIELLSQIVKRENISQNPVELKKHSKDRSFHAESSPNIIVWPKTTEQVSKIVKLANNYGIPITPWGGGSSLEGNPIPVRGGVVLNMTKMNRVIEVFEDDLQVKTQPGIFGDDLNRKLAKYNLFFPTAPGSSHLATIGGMVANNAGGMHAIKYGVTGDSVLKLEIVLANGQIIRTGNRSIKSVSGYDLKNLFIGSEGTLGIITEIVLKLIPLPKHKIAAMVSFEKITDATNTTLAILRSDIKPTAVEFMDKIYMKYVNKVKQTTLPEKPTLIIEFQGEMEVNILQLKKIRKICKENKSIYFHDYITSEEIRLLWQYRRAVRPAIDKLLPNRGVLSAEIGVPISKLESFLQKAEKVSRKYNLQTIMFGHIADGNFHGWALYKLNNKKSWGDALKLNEELIKFAIGVDGTTTGEHGVGIGKRKFMKIEHPTSLEIMKNIKKFFDPKGILNPGKIFFD